MLALLAGLVPASARAENGVRKGPWLMDPRVGSITVMVERDAPGPLHVRAWPIVAGDELAAAPGGIQVDDPAPQTLHEVVLRGLAPGVRYRYEVSGPGMLPVGGTFTSPPASPVPFRFVIYGDTRSNATRHAATVRAVQAEAPDFVLHTGDLMGDGRREDQWQRFFDIERDLLRDTLFVPVIGNHEIQRPSSTGVDNFRRYVHCEPGSPRPELDYTIAYGSLRLIVANAYDDWTLPEMRAWLERELSRARAEVPNGFVIVAMHWGLCSCGPHGENRAMRSAGIDALLRRHGVDLLLAGHDHLYERGDDQGLRYIVTGGGAAELYHPRSHRPYVHATASEHHYVRADVEEDRIVFTALRPDGTRIDRCALTRTGWQCPRSVAATGTLARLADACDERAPGHIGRGGPRGVVLGVLAAASTAVSAAWLARVRRASRARGRA